MKYCYAYKSSDGVRHEAEIDAASRDEAFEILRKDGIRPIKVVAADGSKANGEVRVLGIPRKVVFGAVVMTAVAAAAITWIAGKHGRNANMPTTPAVPAQSGMLRRVAMPLPRQEIHGNRRRLEIAPTNLFDTAIETYLSKFSEPGREVTGVDSPPDDDLRVKELLAVLDVPIHFADDEYTEFVDLKRITAGIKKEMADFIRGGNTPGEYFKALEERQRIEVSHRAKAEKRLKEMVSTSAEPAQAYDFWLKANAQLQSMGIYPLPLPDTLRDYQFNLNIDE